jgi:hypothetical protein
MIENIFSHLTTRQGKGVFSQAWNIKLSAKTLNRLKFPSHLLFYGESWPLSVGGKMFSENLCTK